MAGVVGPFALYVLAMSADRKCACGTWLYAVDTTCPRCGRPAGTEVPIYPPSERPSFAKVATVLGLLLAVVALAVAGVASGVIPIGRIHGNAFVAPLQHDLSASTGDTIVVRCQDTWKQKGRISDCTAYRSGTHPDALVLVTQIDLSGHFRYQVTDPAFFLP